MKTTFDIMHELSDRISTKTIIFCDMDGTLVDTNYANYLSYRQTIRKVTHGKVDIQFSPSRRFSRKELKEVMPHLSDVEHEKIVSLKAEYYKNYLPETKLNSTLADIINKFSKTNVIVLVTNCQEDRAIVTLRYHGLLESFTHVFCRNRSSGEDVANKYKNAMIRLGASPESVLVFENEIADVGNAILAGVPPENIVII